MMIYLAMIDSPEGKSKFTKLYEDYRGLMYHVAEKVLHNHHDAEDAVHQAFVTIAERIDIVDVSVESRLRSYVVTITENRAIDLYRSRQKWSCDELDENAVGIPVEYEGPNEAAQCMAKLPARHREVLILKYVHGYSFRETARLMNTTEVNAKKLALRAKGKLEAMCREEGIL